MADLFALSEHIIDNGITDLPVNRINLQLSELFEDVAIVEAFSHSIVFKTDEGLVVFDASNEQCGPAVVKAIREWSPVRFDTLVYTHGHVDHVGGSAAFQEDARQQSGVPLNVIAHENLPKRLKRYQMTDGYNLTVNRRQFGQRLNEKKLTVVGKTRFLPPDTVFPTITYSEQLCFRTGESVFQLYHDKGETDDHTWAWIPHLRTICAGDFFIWNFPNAGNPQKAQRYPLEWAQTLRRMAAMEADFFLPAHGLPIRGRVRISTVLLDAAQALDTVIQQTLEMMNAGLTLNDTLAAIQLPADLMAKPYLRPLYDEPDFVIRNIWRLYGGWYDGNPSRLKPPSDQALAMEMAKMAGGALKLAQKAGDLAEKGELSLASHLVEAAKDADPNNLEVHAIRSMVYTILRKEARSLMSKGIYRSAAEESRAMINAGD
ncbi:MBL fold metallo-hydrolase [bacterium]|nr:MBL fold metallo-hydrolase [bacterium]